VALLDDIKLSLRVTSESFDAEAQMLVDAALYDMGRAGVNPSLLELADGDLANAFVKNAVTCYCKANFGYDNAEAERFQESYHRMLNALLNSSENVAAIELDGTGGEPSEEPTEEPSEEPSGGEGGE
jgi:hypothetical protein